jgi:asparagine synthase (glutamine-hydrolysing)
MSGLAGIINFKNGDLENPSEESLKNYLRKRGVVKVHNDSGNYGIFSLNASASFNNNIYTEGGYFINFCGRVDNQEDFKNCNRNNTAKFILREYIKKGVKSFDAYAGAFCFTIFDKNSGKLVCVRDHLGMKPFYYSFDGQKFFFGSEPIYINLLSNKKYGIDSEKITDLILREEKHSDKSFFKGIYKIERGEYIICSLGKLQKYKYHKFQTPDYIQYDDEKEYFDLFRKTFRRVIEDQTKDFLNIGTALSGGLDSSSVTRMLVDINSQSNNKKNIYSYSYRFKELLDSDFKKKDVVGMGGLNHRNIDILQGDYVNDLIDCQGKFPMPCLQGNRYQEISLLNALKKDDIKVFLTGFDGDCTVSYGMEEIQFLIRKWKVLDALKLNNLARKRKGLKDNTLKVIMSYIFMRHLPSKIHLFFKKLKGLQNFDYQHKFLKKEVRNTINYQKLNLRQREYMYDIENGHRNLLNSKHFETAFETLDIDYSNNGIEERHPFCDKRLMELCLNIPPNLKLKNGYSRYILRESLKKQLPNSIRYRMTKSDLSPYFFYSAKKNIIELLQNLVDTNSVIENYIDKKKLINSMANIEGLSIEDITWIVNFNLIDSWVKKNS